jgi:hypothetical protein
MGRIHPAFLYGALNGGQARRSIQSGNGGFMPFWRKRRSYTGISEGYDSPFVGRTPGLQPAAWPTLGVQAGDDVCAD